MKFIKKPYDKNSLLRKTKGKPNTNLSVEFTRLRLLLYYSSALQSLLHVDHEHGLVRTRSCAPLPLRQSAVDVSIIAAVANGGRPVSGELLQGKLRLLR